MGQLLGGALLGLLLHRPALGLLFPRDGLDPGLFLGPLARFFRLAPGCGGSLLALAARRFEPGLGRLLFPFAAQGVALRRFFGGGALLLLPSLALQLGQPCPLLGARRALRFPPGGRFHPGAFVLRRPLRLFFLFAAPLLGLAPRHLGGRVGAGGRVIADTVAFGNLDQLGLEAHAPQPGVKVGGVLAVQVAAQDNQVTGEALAQARRLGDREQLGQPRLHLLAIMSGEDFAPEREVKPGHPAFCAPVSCDMLYSENVRGFRWHFQCRASRAGLSVARYPGCGSTNSKLRPALAARRRCRLAPMAEAGVQKPPPTAGLSSARQTLASPSIFAVEP